MQPKNVTLRTLRKPQLLCYKSEENQTFPRDKRQLKLQLNFGMNIVRCVRRTLHLCSTTLFFIVDLFAVKSCNIREKCKKKIYRLQRNVRGLNLNKLNGEILFIVKLTFLAIEKLRIELINKYQIVLLACIFFHTKNHSYFVLFQYF